MMTSEDKAQLEYYMLRNLSMCEKAGCGSPHVKTYMTVQWNCANVYGLMLDLYYRGLVEGVAFYEEDGPDTREDSLQGAYGNYEMLREAHLVGLTDLGKQTLEATPTPRPILRGEPWIAASDSIADATRQLHAMINDGDCGVHHVHADDVLCEILDQMGCYLLVDEYMQVEKMVRIGRAVYADW